MCFGILLRVMYNGYKALLPVKFESFVLLDARITGASVALSSRAS